MAPAILAVGAVAAVGSAVAQGNANKRNAKAQNAAQKAQIKSGKAQLDIQVRSTIEQAALRQMEYESARNFANQQDELNALDRQSQLGQQLFGLNAQAAQQSQEAAGANFANESGRLQSQLGTQQQLYSNQVGLLSQNLEYGNSQQQIEAQRFQSLLGAEGAELTAEQQRYQQLQQLAAQGINVENERYQALIGAADVEYQVAQELQQQDLAVELRKAQAAEAGRQVYENLEAQAYEEGGKMTAGKRRRMLAEAVFAAQGQASGSLTNEAVQGEDLKNDIESQLRQQLKANNISENTAIQMVREGRIAELANLVAYEQGSRTVRKANDNAELAGINADFLNQLLLQRGDTINAVTDDALSNAQFQAQFANMSAEQQQQLLGRQLTVAEREALMNGTLIAGQQGINDTFANATAQNIQNQLAQNNAARDAARQQVIGADEMADGTAELNRRYRDLGFTAQEVALADATRAQLDSFKAQRDSLKYVPVQAPSNFFNVLGAAAGAAGSIIGGLQQNNAARQAAQIQERSTALNNGFLSGGSYGLPSQQFGTQQLQGISYQPVSQPSYTNLGNNFSFGQGGLLSGGR